MLVVSVDWYEAGGRVPLVKSASPETVRIVLRCLRREARRCADPVLRQVVEGQVAQAECLLARSSRQVEGKRG